MSLIYYQSLSTFRPSRVKPDIWGPSTIKSGYFWSLDCFGGWFSHDVAPTGYIRSLNYQICLFFCHSTLKSIYFFFDSFGRWYSHDAALGQHVRYMWRWDPCHMAILSPFLILHSISLTLLSLYLLIPIQNDGALGSSIPTAASSCGGERREKLRRVPVMEHAERYDTKGSCGRASTTRVVEQEERERRKTHSTWDPPSHIPSMWDSSSHYAKTTLKTIEGPKINRFHSWGTSYI
jgi:hypothetical protein